MPLRSPETSIRTAPQIHSPECVAIAGSSLVLADVTPGPINCQHCRMCRANCTILVVAPAFARSAVRIITRWLGSSLLAERAHQLVAQGLHQVGHHGAVAGLHEGFHRHARNDLDVAE